MHTTELSFLLPHGWYKTTAVDFILNHLPFTVMYAKAEAQRLTSLTEQSKIFQKKKEENLNHLHFEYFLLTL